MQIVSSPTSPPTSIEKAATILKKEPWKASTIILSVSPDDSTLSSSTKLHNITNENIRGVSIMMTVFSIFLIVAITTSIFLDGKQSEQYVGWIAVLGAAIIFGSTGIPMKMPILASVQVDSLVFSLFSTIGIVIITIPLMIFLICINEFEYHPWSIVGAVDIILIGYFSYNAIQVLGYAIAPAIWAGIGMTVAFLWGIIVFEEIPEHKQLSQLAILSLIIGVVCISISSNMKETIQINQTETIDYEKIETDGMETEKELPKRLDDIQIEMTCSNQVEIKDNNVNQECNTVDVEKCEESDLNISESIKTKETEVVESVIPPCQFSWKMQVSAYSMCILTGLCDGSLAVPFKKTISDILDYEYELGKEGLHITFSYLVSFGLSTLFVSPIIFGLYCLLLKKGRIPNLHASHAALPGILSGMLWASANLMSILATYYLGIKIGFPLTQTCVIVAALWGLLYFKEVNARNLKFLAVFVPGISFVIIGACLLGKFG